MSVKNAQIALLRLGFEPGPVDSVYGRRTRAALIKFQRATQLRLSGILDEETWSAIVAQLLSKTDAPMK